MEMNGKVRTRGSLLEVEEDSLFLFTYVFLVACKPPHISVDFQGKIQNGVLETLMAFSCFLGPPGF